MSIETKETIKKTNETFKRIVKEAREAEEKCPFDKGLTAKIKKAGEASQEVVKHIEERSGDKG